MPDVIDIKTGENYKPENPWLASKPEPEHVLPPHPENLPRDGVSSEEEQVCPAVRRYRAGLALEEKSPGWFEAIGLAAILSLFGVF